MIYEVKNNRVVKYIRENWKEWFFVRVQEGEMRPRFYLPVSRDIMTGTYTAWTMPLAPFVLSLVAVKSGFDCFWRDLVQVIELWKDDYNN